MNAADPRNPYDFAGRNGEVATIEIRPIDVGNTFVVSSPAVLSSGGTARSRVTKYEYTLDRPRGGGQVIVMKFRFPEAMPDGGFTAQHWPRFDVTVKGSEGGTFPVPTVLQSSIEAGPSEQLVELLFITE